MPKVLPTFITLFNKPGIGVEINEVDAMVNTPIHFTAINYTCKHAVIRGVHFTEDVHFDKVPLGNGIKFENCKFDKQLLFENCAALGYTREFNSDSVSVYFNNCDIQILNFPTINTFERGIKIFNKTVIHDLNVEGLQITSGSFRIDNSTVSDRFRISNITIERDGEMALVKTSVTSSIRYENINVGGIFFLDSKIDKDVYLWAGTTMSFVFNNGKFSDDFIVKGLKSEQTSIIGAEFNKEFTIDFDDKENDVEGYHRKLFIMSNKFGQLLDISGSSDIIIEELNITNNRSQEGTIQFVACSFKEAAISGDFKNGNIRFDTCEFEKLQFTDLTNSATISLVSCQAIPNVQSLFEIENSNVGKLELFNCSLDSFTKVRIADSLVIDMVSMGVEWFDDSILEVGGDNNDHRGRRELYRQLKQMCDKQGDRIQALEFQALELISFRKEIKEAKGWWNKDRWILRLSVTNDFGLHWGKPLVWITVLSLFLFYPLIVTSASPKLFASPAKSWKDVEVTWNELVHYGDVLPQLFNPARLTFRLFPEIERLGFWTHFWDGCQRIVLAFFIVQIVAAFRKYVRN